MENVDYSSRASLSRLLGSSGEEREALFRQAAAVKEATVGNKVYFRGLIEFSNRCRKNCLYCGIRSGNRNVERYSLTDDEVVEAARFALHNRYGSIVLQSGEQESKAFTQRIDRLLRKIHAATGGKLRITLSCGEQEPEVYRRWFESGGQRYLLRIETSNPELYEKLHPQDGKHLFRRRMECLESIRETGYQTGTGVMIGLPFQSLDDLAGDLLFIRDFAADMVGMGPYLEHADTPLYSFRDQLLTKQERFDITLKMIALLRLLMPGINMAATTAMQAIDPAGREKAILVGANVIMPNITPGSYRDNYLLYEGKPCTAENPDDCSNCLEARVAITGHQIAWEEWGDSVLYTNRTGRQ